MIQKHTSVFSRIRRPRLENNFPCFRSFSIASLPFVSLTFSPSHFCLLSLLSVFLFLRNSIHSFFFLSAPFPFISSISFLLILFPLHS